MKLNTSNSQNIMKNILFLCTWKRDYVASFNLLHINASGYGRKLSLGRRRRWPFGLGLRQEPTRWSFHLH